MVDRMTETYFLQHRNTEIEINLESSEKIRLTIGTQPSTYLTPGEAHQLATMLQDAAEGKDYNDYDSDDDTGELPYEREEEYGEHLW